MYKMYYVQNNDLVIILICEIKLFIDSDFLINASN
jgi:putative component of toxin-antitoxin plasmid stabilization module